MKCPRCNGLVIRQRTEWWCVAHGSFGHAVEARDIIYEHTRGGSEPGKRWRRITDREIREMQRRYLAGESVLFIARMMGVGHSTVSRYVHGLEPLEAAS